MTVCKLHWPGALAPTGLGRGFNRPARQRCTLIWKEANKAMPFVPFENCCEVTIEGRVDNQMTINTLGVRSTTGPISFPSMVTLRDQLAEWFTLNLAPLYNVAFHGTRLKVQGLTNQNGLATEVALPDAAGEVTGEALPNNCTMAVSFRSQLSGRSYRGRNYVPVLSDSEVDGNFIDPAFATNVLAAYQQLVFPNGGLPDGFIWVILSRKTNNDWRTTGVFTEVAEVLVTDLVVDSMRTRLPGRGR